MFMWTDYLNKTLRSFKRPKKILLASAVAGEEKNPHPSGPKKGFFVLSMCIPKASTRLHSTSVVFSST